MMISLKMWCLLPVSVLLLLFITPTVTEVVESMSDCQGFLLENNSPQVPGILDDCDIQDQNRYKVICQTYDDTKRFLTLYDTENKIPVFSAYKYRGTERGEGEQFWKIEPQLENTENDKNMQDCIITTVYKKQAGDNDYQTDSSYDKGHLFPYSYAFGENDKTSTYTLTNAVPQISSFNKGSWAKMETCVKCILDEYCKNNNDQIEGYAVTGAKPGPQTSQLNEKVNVPTMLWSAFCCYSKKLSKWIASAHWGENVPAQPDNLATRTLQELYDELSTDNNRFEAFPNTQCPRDETVAGLYSEINNNKKRRLACKCPPAGPV